jgi:hypothetical protein
MWFGKQDKDQYYPQEVLFSPGGLRSIWTTKGPLLFRGVSDQNGPQRHRSSRRPWCNYKQELLIQNKVIWSNMLTQRKHSRTLFFLEKTNVQIFFLKCWHNCMCLSVWELHPLLKKSVPVDLLMIWFLVLNTTFSNISALSLANVTRVHPFL